MPTHYFRVDGADQETGEETYLVLQADSKPQAEKIARKQGLLISSVRVAKASDWESTPKSARHGNGEAELANQEQPTEQSPAPPEIATAPEVSLPPFVEAKVVAPAAQTPVTAPREPVAVTETQSSGTAAAVILGCVGGALVVGGVLALVLALWPDNVARNELQQLDFRLNQLDQTIIGSMLVLGGLLVFVLTAQIRACRR